MKKFTISIILLFVLSIFAEKKLVIYRDNVVQFAAVLSQIDSIVFEDFQGNAGMKLISAGGNSFQMGGSSFFNADPIHTVSFTSNFYMDSTEVTQAQYEAVMSHSTFGYDTYTNPNWITVGSKYPAYATWYDAILYCNAKSKATGKDTVYTYSSLTGTPGNGCTYLSNFNADFSKNGFRLPTEAEWEYSCRAGTTGDYYGNLNDIGWYEGNSGGSLHEVANRNPNSYNLYDMSGNADEFVWDWFGDYSAGSFTDPKGPSTGDFKVVRGGTYGLVSDYLCSASRLKNWPSGWAGFRTVCK